jgi:hypothetical protein
LEHLRLIGEGCGAIRIAAGGEPENDHNSGKCETA